MGILKEYSRFFTANCFALFDRQPAGFRLRATFFASSAITTLLLQAGSVDAQTPGGLQPLNGLNPALLSNQGTLGTGGGLGTSGGQTTANPFGQQQNADQNQANNQTSNQADTTQNGAAQNAATQDPNNPLAGRVGAAELTVPTAGSVRELPEVFGVAEQQRIARELTEQGGGLQTSDTAPFEPLGIRAGKFILRPAVDTSVGYTTNSTNDVTGSGSTFVSVGPELNIESDFARHALGLEISAGFDRFASGDDPSDLELVVNANGRLDVDGDTSITGAINFVAGEDDLTGVADDPLETTTIASVQLDHVINQFDTLSAVRIERNSNGSFTDPTGVEVDQDDLNSTLIGANFRGTLRTGASIEPFVEVDAFRETFDEDTDELGNERNVTGLRGLIGVEIDRGEKLSGEFSLGFAQNIIDGDGIEDFGAFVAEFNIAWSPERLTTVTLTGSTTLDAFPSVATPGDTTYILNLNVERELRENLTANVGSGLVFQVDGADQSTDTTLNGALGLAYQLGRNIALSLDYNYAQQFTADGTADFTANTISLGVRAER